MADRLLNNGGIEEEENSNDERNLANDDYYDGEFGQTKRRQHRKALDIKNNGLSADGLQIMLDRYNVNVCFIESIQTASTPDRALVLEMQGQTASQIYTRCSKRDNFTETHVGDDIMATFSTIRDYRAACDMQRMDPDRFQHVFDEFAAWDETQYEEFKRNYTLEYVFRRILQRDTRYRTKYMRLLKQCQESTDYSTINRPLLPLPTPKFLTGDSQLELCNSSLRSKLRNMRRRKTHGGADESSPESEAFLGRLNDAVCSFFRRLDFVEETQWSIQSPSPTTVVNAKQDPEPEGTKQETNGGGNRKRTLAKLIPSHSMVRNDNKRMASTANVRPAAQVNTLARAFLRKAFRGPIRANALNQPKKEPDVTPQSLDESPYPDIFLDHLNGSQIPADTPPNESEHGSVMNDESDLGIQQRRPSLLASKRPSSYMNKPGTSSRISIHSLTMMMLKKAKNGTTDDQYTEPVDNFGNDDNTPASTNGYDLEEDETQNQPVSLLGVGADEPIDEEDLKSILNDLAGMHAVVKCEDFGRIIEHGSIFHPNWGIILVRRGRVVRLGTARSGFQAPNPRMEFQFPMENLIDYIPSEKIRFDDERNLYLNGILTDFYFLQS